MDQGDMHLDDQVSLSPRFSLGTIPQDCLQLILQVQLNAPSLNVT